jgi:hypothetical protein
MKDLTTYEAAHILLDDEFANWSYNGAFALVNYIEEVEDETSEEYELDRVALRCEFSEYRSLVVWADSYGADLGEAPEDDDERDEEIREYIQDRGVLIEFDGGIIVSEF